jgi:integrase/recombinase XerD
MHSRRVKLVHRTYGLPAAGGRTLALHGDGARAAKVANHEVLQAFETHQQARGLARNTIERRRYSLRKLALFAEPVPLLAVPATLIEDWLASYPKAETKHAYLSDVKAFFYWACRRGMADADPTEDMDSVRRPAALPRPISEDDLARAVLLAVDQRLKLVLLLGSLAGLRRSEIAALRAEDCDQRRILVRKGKGSKDRVVPMHPYLWTVLRGYGVQSGWLFEAPHGGPLASSTIGGWVRAHFAELDIHACLHQTRHRFGTKLAEVTNGNMLAVRDLLGHARLTTTEGYVRFDTSGLRGIVNDLPVAGQDERTG